MAHSYYLVARSLCPDPTFRLTLTYCFVFEFKMNVHLINIGVSNIKLLLDHLKVYQYILHVFYHMECYFSYPLFPGLAMCPAFFDEQ